ncbi:TetR family transcriptional regulator [Paenibacillus sp. MY03]|uniref:TetR/AcrR family transcriptional regulator n=1 Tax=Paenibacillaceae TaxID=186822 RepID=UPI000B3D4AF7|nr:MULTISPECIES: TetR/AcrR family transcriptional regulator [Paenibacillaceae]OUS75610.1 TetR family transcriptional regulator [Paenibacillus sp. MY03]QTH40765.1 TetR/AcrR family transcriptional regulator [Cohnella sp. LGH]
MDGYQKRRDQKKKDILRSAVDLFLTYGIQKVSIAEIASKANVSQVTIYNYFGSKHNLVEEMLVFYLDQIWSEYEKMLTNDMPFIEKIKSVMFAKIDSANNVHPDTFTHFMKKYATGVPYLEKMMQEKIMPGLMTLIEEGKQQGYVDPGLSNESILVFIQMFKDYMQKEEAFPHLQKMTGDLNKLFFYGLVGSKHNWEE